MVSFEDYPGVEVDHITMDFVASLPWTSTGVDNIWVIIDGLTMSAHFLCVQSSFCAMLGTHMLLHITPKMRGELCTSIKHNRNPRIRSICIHKKGSSINLKFVKCYMRIENLEVMDMIYERVVNINKN